MDKKEFSELSDSIEEHVQIAKGEAKPSRIFESVEEELHNIGNIKDTSKSLKKG